MVLPSRVSIGGVSFSLGALLGAGLALWILGQQACAHRVETQWRTRLVEVPQTDAARDWGEREVECEGGERARFRVPPRKELLRLAREAGFTPAELGLEPGTRTVTVEVPGEDRVIEVPVDRPHRLFGELEGPPAPWGWTGWPYLDAAGNFRLRARAEPEPLAEAPMVWSVWLKYGRAEVEPDAALAAADPLGGAADVGPGEHLAAELRLDALRWHRLHVAPYLEVGRMPGLDWYGVGGASIGYELTRFRVPRDAGTVEVPVESRDE